VGEPKVNQRHAQVEVDDVKTSEGDLFADAHSAPARSASAYEIVFARTEVVNAMVTKNPGVTAEEITKEMEHWGFGQVGSAELSPLECYQQGVDNLPEELTEQGVWPPP
jgi:hypothetical protein